MKEITPLSEEKVWSLIEYSLAMIDKGEASPQTMLNAMGFMMAYLANELDIPDIVIHKIIQKRMRAIQELSCSPDLLVIKELQDEQ